MRYPCTVPQKMSGKVTAIFLMPALALAPVLPEIAYATSLSEVPPYLTSTQVPPNLGITLDDSGSMAWDYLPDRPFNDSKKKWSNNNVYKFSSSVNGVYFNPSTNYKPGVENNGTDYKPDQPPSAALNDPYMGSSTNKTDLTRYVWCTSKGKPTTTGSAWSEVALDPDLCQSNKDSTYEYGPYAVKSYYWRLKSTGGADPTDPADFERVDIVDPAVAGSSKDSIYNAGPGTYAEQIQNFANWWSYYRTRTLSAKSALGRALFNLPLDFRVARQNLNANTTIHGTSSSVAPVAFSSARADLFKWLNTSPADNGTPLKVATKRMGEYFSNIDNVAKDDGGQPYTCQPNYHLLMSDGYWNGSTPKVGNRDGTSQTLGDGSTYPPAAPYSDDFSDTLADVAMYYWQRDLISNLANEVTPNQEDPATWQHMSNFMVSLGVSGSLTHPSFWTPSNVGTPDTDWLALKAGTKPWPQAVADSPTALDDLWHAAVNSRGGYYNTGNPDQLIEAFTDIIARIQNRIASTATLAFSGERLSSDSMVYQPAFTSGDWSGDILAYHINPDTGTVSTDPVWSAQTMISAQNWDSSRRIVTLKGSAGVPFRWTNLSSDQQAALGGSSSTLENVRGNTSGDGTSFRNRKGRILGDIINAAPVQVGAPRLSYSFNGYSTFKQDQANRRPMIYAAANDGMLHAIDPGTGQEAWAYVPSQILGKLPTRVSKTSFEHQNLINATPTVGDYFDGAAWHTLLVGGFGGGSKGLYALDITTPPKDADNETRVATQVVKWEISNASAGFEELGNVLAKPLLIKHPTHGWVVAVASGYNNSTGSGKLFFINPETGAKVEEVDTGAGSTSAEAGLSALTAADFDHDGITDAIYGGDLLGNLWKFNLTAAASTPAGTGPAAVGTTIAYGGNPLFMARDSSGNAQPITTKPVISRLSGNWGVLFGTGRYLGGRDPDDTSRQSFYGLIDQNASKSTHATPISDRSQLIQQILTLDTSTNPDSRTSSSNAVTYPAKKGWYIDLPDGGSGTKPSERVITDPEIKNGLIIFKSYVPANDPCVVGGYSWITAVDYVTGGNPSGNGINPFRNLGLGNNATSIRIGDGLAPGGTVKDNDKGQTFIIYNTGKPESGSLPEKPKKLQLYFKPTVKLWAWREIF